MAISVPSTSSTTFTSSPIVITKPTGLAVGDIMVCHLGFVPASFLSAITPPSGWAYVTGSSLSDSVLLYKVADSSDVGATNFSFSFTGFGGITGAGGILRVSDAFLPLLATSSTDTDLGASTTPTFTNTITPLASDSLIILAAAGDLSDNVVSTFTIATSNPTWTQAYQFNSATAGGRTVVCAYAIRSAATATGDSSFTGADASGDWTGILAAITPNRGPINLYTWNGVTKSTISTMNGTALSAMDKWNDIT